MEIKEMEIIKWVLSRVFEYILVSYIHVLHVFFYLFIFLQMCSSSKYQLSASMIIHNQ